VADAMAALARALPSRDGTTPRSTGDASAHEGVKVMGRAIGERNAIPLMWRS
jgi:hypothetical protein